MSQESSVEKSALIPEEVNNALRAMLKCRIGIWEITTANLPEVWARIFIVQESLGTNGELRLVFPEVRDAVGFSVPNGVSFGSAELMKRVGNRLRERAEAEGPGRARQPWDR